MLRRKVMFYKVSLGINKSGQIVILSKYRRRVAAF